MLKILSNEEMRQLDNKTIHDIGIPGIVLMERAAQGCVNALMDYTDNRDFPLTYVFCGKGNNGGDGLAIARYLQEARYHVHIISTCEPDAYKGDAAINAEIVRNMKIPWSILENADDLSQLLPPQIIVDALYGTGFSGSLNELDAAIVAFINRSSAFVMSVDIPSGINGNLPVVAGDAVKADLTVTMAAAKKAHLFYPARFFVGELQITAIGIPGYELHHSRFPVNLIEEGDIFLPFREENAHKYNFGRLLIIAGSYGMAGAAIMAAKAASLIGGGMVHLAVPASIYEVAASQLMGEIVIPVDDHESGKFCQSSLNILRKEIEWADAILMGPGIGTEQETTDSMKELLAQIEKPVIIDADAIRAVPLSEQPNEQGRNRVLTPHYGEFSRVSGIDAKTIRDNPLDIAREFAMSSKMILNLKNAPSIVATPDGEVFVNSTGNAALAKAGSGDVLAGIMIGLLGQGMEMHQAAWYANYIHGYIADLYVAEHDEYSLTPEKQLSAIPLVIKKINAFE